jgi:hypothetical protein
MADIARACQSCEMAIDHFGIGGLCTRCQRAKDLRAGDALYLRMEINPVSVDGRLFFTARVGAKGGVYCMTCMGLIAYGLVPFSTAACLDHRCPRESGHSRPPETPPASDGGADVE